MRPLPLCLCSFKGNIVASADDSKCFRLILVQDHGDKLQDDLNKLFQWFRVRGMEFIAKKVKVFADQSTIGAINILVGLN